VARSAPVLAIAHRGDPIGHRENTLPAFAAAVAQGADMLELDLRRTRDGAIVVLHNQSLYAFGSSTRPWETWTSPR
jgi:glycerophosphoryl diester phosphodiesterase